MKPCNPAILKAIMSRTGAQKPTLGMRLAAVLETRAKERNVNIYDLLEQLGVHHSIYSRWRIGETSPSSKLIERLEVAGIVTL